MLSHRRLTALVAAVSFVGATLAIGVVAPSAQAAATALSAQAPQRAPHDPATYYAGTEGLSGATLAAKLHTIIKGHTKLSYAQVYNDLAITDVDPANASNLIDFYSGTSIPAANRCGSSCPIGFWNREHTWPQSHGNFGTTAGIGTDLFHMRPEFGNTNSSRGNKDFDNGGTAAVPSCADCHSDGDSFEPRAAVKGDLARGLLYLAVRYEGDGGELDLKMNDRTCNGSGAPNMGKLSTLVAWALADPPDAREQTRNDLIDSDYQHNRNPFIDHPEWVTSIFGNGVDAGPACGGTAGTDYVPGGTTTNQTPTATSTTVTTAEDTPATTALQGADGDGDPLTWSVSQLPGHGTASVSGSSLSYEPARDYAGSDQVGVTVSDGRGGTAPATVTITVTPVNDAPVASDVTAAASRDASAQITLTATDVDNDATTLTYGVGTLPAHGLVAISGATATYTPAAGFTGDDTFTYVATDPAGAVSAPATVRVVVTVGPSAPVASDVSASTVEDQPVTFTLPASDANDDFLTYSLRTPAAHGLVKITGNQATYTPATGFHGADSFTFTASDAATISAPATASITVTSSNHAPIATSGSASTAQGSAVTVTLVGADADADPLTYAVATGPTHGLVTISGNQATYTPADGFSGADSFTWTVSDGEATSTGTTTLTVVRANTAPTVADVSATADQDGQVQVALLGQDVDGDTLTYATATGPAHGTVAIDGVTATYTPAAGWAGTDSFTYVATDPSGAVSAPATVTISVTAANQDPVMTSAPALRVTAGSPSTLTIGATDPDGDPVSLSAVSVPSLGSATIAGGLQVTYTPSVRSGSDTFQVTVSDGRGGTASAQIDVDIAARTAPLSVSAPSVPRGGLASITVTAAGPPGPQPTGAATILLGGQPFGTVFLVDGAGTLSATMDHAGAIQVSATYAGDGLFAPAASAPTTLSVARSASTLGLTARHLKRGRKGFVAVSVGPASGAAPTGTVTLKVAKKRYTAVLVGGVATFRVAKLPKKAKVTVSAAYSGDTDYVPGTASRAFRLKR